MDIVPESGDFTIQYYWPSGAKLELQIYLKKGENALDVLESVLEAEQITNIILPDVIRMLRDTFIEMRRHPSEETQSGKTHSQGIPQEIQSRWKEYSQLFERQGSLQELRATEEKLKDKLQVAAEHRSNALLEEESAYNALLSQNPSNTKLLASNHEDNINEIEASYLLCQEQLKHEFWEFVDSKTNEKTYGKISVPTVIKIDPPVFESSLQVSLGAQNKRTYGIGTIISEDICFLPVIPIRGAENQEEFTIQLVHPENIYKRYISCLIFPYHMQDGKILISPDLIRKCEESPENHFQSIRKQVPTQEGVFFTRHSNLEGVEGVFHIPPEQPLLLREILKYANSQGVRQLGLPIVEWIDHMTVREIIFQIKAGLNICPVGTLDQITIIIEDTQGNKEVISACEQLFAEKIISIN